MAVEIEKVVKDVQDNAKVLYEQLKRMIPGLPDEYDATKLAKAFDKRRKEIGLAFIEQSAICFVVKKMETRDQYERILKNLFSIGLKTGDRYAKTFQLATEKNITNERIEEIGYNKFLLLDGAPDEYIEEFKESGTIEGKKVSDTSVRKLKEIINDIETFKELQEAEKAKTEYDLEFEKEQNTTLLQENKQLKKHVKMLKDQLMSTQGRLLEFQHESILIKTKFTLQEANRQLTEKPLESEFVQKMANAILLDIEDEMHRLVHNVRGLVHPEPYDRNNPDLKRIKNDPRFDWTKLNETE